MANAWTLFKREFTSYFLTPIAYVFIVIFLLLSGVFTFYLGNFFSRGSADLIPFFNFHPWLYLFLIPALTMRTWAEERKSGSIELLFTLPITMWEAVLAKFFAAWVFTAIALFLTFPLWITVNYLGSPDNGVILASYLGSLLMAGCYLAIGCCFSALTKNQVIAFVLTVVVCLGFVLSGLNLVTDFFSAWAPTLVVDTISSFSFLAHFNAISKGVIDLRDLVFFSTLIVFWLFTNATLIELKKADYMDKQYPAKRNILTTGAIALALVLLFGINIFSNYAFTSTRLDLTAKQLFTLSAGTKNILQEIEEPLTLRLYYSKKLSTGLASINSYATQVRELLEEYQRLAKGKIQLQVIDPEPFSEQEDVAIGYGLQGVPIDESGSHFYFGLVGTNSTDAEKHIPFFQQDRESHLEYDITQLLFQLMHPAKPKVGVITSLPMQGTPHAFYGQGGQQAWSIWQQMNEFYELETFEANITQIPEDINILLLAAPTELTDAAVYAVDQFVLQGGRLLAFLDTFSETASRPSPVATEDINKINKLLTAWGVTLEPDKVVADRGAGKQVWFTKDNRQLLVEYPFWLDVDGKRLDVSDLVTGDLQMMTLSTPGYFNIRKEQGLTITSLLRSTADATAFAASAIKTYQADPEKVARDYSENDKIYDFALRIHGKAKSAFPQGKPLHVETPLDGEALPPYNKPHVAISNSDINVILVSDSDLLQDRFWLRTQNFLGQQLIMPIASNGSFALNALDNLSGSGDLISVRSRGTYSRPFSKLREIQQQAEMAYRSTEAELQQRLQDTEKRLENLNDHKIEGNKVVLSPAQKQEIENFRDEQVQIRRQLRNVQHELQKDIDRITAQIKLINIGFMPVVVGFTGIGLILWRRKHSRAA